MKSTPWGHAFDEMFARLEESFNRERQFASDASHELRTPIAAILTQCEYALSLPEDNAEQRMCLERIQRQAKRMSTLVSQLLELTRADQQRAAIRKESFDLSELIEVVLEQMEPQAQACGIEFRTRLKPNLSFFGDPSLMMRLILNLVSNAIQYGRSGGFVLVSLTDDGRQAELRVEDNGIGIAPEHTPHIFERFYRADPSRSAPIGQLRPWPVHGCLDRKGPWRNGRRLQHTGRRHHVHCHPAVVIAINQNRTNG